MQQDDVELHALACELADVDALDYDQALARARQQFGAVQEYAHAWDECAAYLEVLTVLERGEQPTVAQLNTLMRADRVVRYVLAQVR